MKSIAFILTVCVGVLLGVNQTQAATTVSGNLLADTTWDTSGSPYTIAADLVLYPGYILTIEPGVEVLVDAGVDVDIRGQLLVNGTSTTPVTITGSVDPTTSWSATGGDGIRINSDQGGSLTASYMHISHMHTAIQVDCCYASDLNFTITDSTFSDNTVGIFGYDGPNTITVESTTFQNNTYAVKGVDINLVDASFDQNTYGLHYTSGVNVTCSEFTNNTAGVGSASNGSISSSSFTDNVTAFDEPWDSLSVSSNTITNNTTGFYLEDNIVVSDNNIYDNAAGNVVNGSSQNLTFESNWWNSTDASAIAATITDAYDEVGLGIVDIDPWLTGEVDTVADCAVVDETAPAEVILGLIQKNPWNKTITLNWMNPTDIDFDHIQIIRMDKDGTAVTLTETETSEQYIDSSIEYGMTYTYTLSTVDSSGNASVGVTTDAKRVKSPHVHHLRLQARGAAIVARWERLPLRLNPAVGYIVYYGTAADDLTSSIDVGNARMVTIPELVEGQWYYVAVTAYNGDGVEGPLSIIKSIQLWNSPPWVVCSSWL